jgi:hypothetical protein
LNEQSWNVVENKGPLWKTSAEAGMFMKTQVLNPLELECHRKQKGLTLVTARWEWEPVARTSGLEVRTFNSAQQLETNSVFERAKQECH